MASGFIYLFIYIIKNYQSCQLGKRQNSVILEKTQSVKDIYWKCDE